MLTNEEVRTALTEKRNATSLSDRINAELGSVDLNIEKTVQDFGFTVPTYMVADINRKGIIKPKYKNYVGGYGNENRLALQQGSGEKAFNGVVKFLGKTGLRATGALGTITYGIGQAIADKDFRSIIDNDLNRALDDAEAALDRNFANHYSDEELSRSILGKMGTANFWFDQVGDGLAFVAGALLPEVALTIATGGAGGISLAGSLARIGGRSALRRTAGATAGAFGRSGSSELASALTKSSLRKATATEVRGLTAMSPLRSSVDQAGMSVLREAVRRGASRGAAIGRGLDATGRLGRYIGMGAFHEAGIESRHSFKEMMDEFTFTFLDEEGRLPTLEEIREYSSIAETATNNIFWGNVALLSVTNIPMLGKAYGLGSSGFLKETSQVFKRAGNKILGLEPKIVKGVAQELKPTRFQKVIGNAYKIGTKPIAEGMEEMSQGFMSGAGAKYVEAKYNGNDSYTFLQGLKEIIPEKLTSQEGWEEFTVGAIIGMLGGNLSKAGGVLAGKDMGGNWGIAGLGGSESYAAAVERVNKLTELQRKSYNAFTSMNRANSVLQFNKTGESEVIQDVVGDFEFFKGHEGLMSFEEMQKNYNTAVDMIEFTEEMKEEAGFATSEDVDAYKKSLKEGFKERYDLYKDGQAFADNLGIGSLKAGNQREVRDALAFQYMVGGRYNENAKNIAKTIARVTGIDGAFDALKFYDGAITERLQSLKSKYSELTEKRDATRKELVTQTQLLDEAKNNLESARVAEKAEDIKKYTDRVALLNNNRTVLVSTLQQLESETNSVRSLANEEIKAVSDRFTDVSESPAPTVDDLLRSTKALEDYITALNVSGKQGDANVLMSMIEQYKVYGTMAFEADNFTQRMIASDFFSSSEGEQTLKRLVGDKYENRTEFREFLNSEEELFHKKFGFDQLTPDQVVDRIENFDELSDREKFKVESLIRMGLATDLAFVAGEVLAENVNNSVNTDVSVVPETDTSAIDAVNDVLTERIQGDTVFGTTAVFDESNPNRLEALRTYINQLVEQINLIKTKGLGDKALELGVLKQKIQKLTELLNQLEEGNYPIEQINALLGSETLSESVGFQTMIDNGMPLIDAVNQKIAEQLEDYKNRLKAVEKQYNERLRRLEEAEVEDMPENKVFNTVDGGYVIDGVKYYNNRTNPLEAISRDSDGNIVSVTLTDKDGGVSVFTGEILDELSYNIILKDSATTGGSLESTIRNIETEGRSERFKKIAQERQEAIEALTAEKDKTISNLLDEARKVRDKSRAEQVREIIDEANKKIYELQLEAQRLGGQQTATNGQTDIERRRGLNGVEEIVFSNPNFRLEGFEIDGNYWNVVTSIERAKVLVNINGVIVPFYLTTGRAGKGLVPGWYPFFGIGKDGWLNKTDKSDMETYYERYWGKETADIVKSISEELNSFYGTDPSTFKNDGDPNATSRPLTTLADKVEDYINSKLNYTPAINDANARKTLRSNVEQLGREINAKYDAELDALNNQTASEQQGQTVEQQKADVEIRRQEELKPFIEELRTIKEKYSIKKEFDNSEANNILTKIYQALELLTKSEIESLIYKVEMGQTVMSEIRFPFRKNKDFTDFIESKEFRSVVNTSSFIRIGEELEKEIEQNLVDFLTGDAKANIENFLKDKNIKLDTEYDINDSEILDQLVVLSGRNKKLFKKILPFIKKVNPKIIYSKDLRKGVAGEYKIDENVIYINIDSINKKNGLVKLAETILHESIHSVTAYATHTVINKNNPAFKEAYELLTPAQINNTNELLRILKDIQQNDLLKNEYGASDINELIAELSNENFVKKLRKTGFLSKIINAIRKIIGLPTDNYSALKNIMLSLASEVDKSNVSALAKVAKKSISKLDDSILERIKYLEGKIAEINAKYDAELAELNNQSTSEQQGQTVEQQKADISSEIEAIKAERDRRLKELGDEVESTNVVDEVLQAVNSEVGNIRQTYDREIEALQKEKEGAESQAIVETEEKIAELEQQKQEAIAEVISRVGESTQELALHEANSLIEELDNELRSLEEQLIELELEEARGEDVSQESRESIENRIAEINTSKEGMLERETKRILQEYQGELQKKIEEVNKTFNELIAEQKSKPSEEVVSIEQRIAEIRKERDAKIDERVSSLLSGLDKAVKDIAKSEAKKEYKKQLKEEWERFTAEMSKNKVVSELEGEMQAEIETTLKEINDKLEELQLTPREEVEEGATLRGDGTYYTVNGITYKRNDVLTETESPVGIEISRRFATNVVVDGVYRLVEAETLQPSHHGDGTQNPRFFSPGRQPKERDSKASIMNKDAIARAPRFNDLSNSENPYTGAPVIDSRGEIIQGNNRTIGLKEGYRQNKEGYVYKQALVENAEQFGFTKEQVLGMDNPVLVFEAKEVKRVTLSNEVAESNPLSETNAIELGNYVAEDLETGVVNIDVERLNARVPLKVKRAIVERLFRNNENEETVNALIRRNYSDLIELLKGFLSLSNYEKLSGGVAEPGNVAIVENIIQEFFFMEATPEVRVAWENLSHNMRRGIELSLGYIFAIPELNQGLKDIHRAIVAIYEYQVWRGESYMAFNEWVRSQDMFEGSPLTRFSDEQLNIAKSLVNTRRQSEVVDLFKRYVTSMTNLGVDPSQVSMFGDRELKTKEEALKDVFGEEVFGSQIIEETERLLAEKQAVEQAIKEKYETIINEIKETDGRDITALRGILNRGRVGTSISNALGELNDDVGEGSGGVISNERIQQAIGRVRAELALLGEEVSNLNRLFDFTESTEFKEYVDLLKKEDRTAEEDARLEDLESTLDNWSFIAGTVAGGVALSDVIQQLVAIQQMEMVERGDTRQPVESMVEEASRVLNRANNEDIALNQTHATSVRVDKSTTEIAGLTPEYFKELIGEELFSEVRVHPTKNTLLLSNEVVDKINASGQILIFEAMNGIPTVYSNVRRVEVDMSGRISLKPIVSDYDSGLDNNSVYDLQAGEELFFEIDQDSTYNKELIEKAAEEAEQRLLTEKERKDFIKKEVGKRLLTDNRVIELQKIIRGKTEVKTPDDALKIKEAENELKEITQEITKEVEALSLTETKNEGVISEETKKELINQLRIYVVDGKGRRVNMLKGVRDEGASTEVSAKFLALRTEILSDLNKVIQAFMTGETLSTKASKVKVNTVFPGLPNFDIGLNTENEAVKRETVFTPKMAESIHDVGYVENGKVHTKNETSITNTMFVKQGLEESVGTSGKIPIVVFKKGNQTIAYPVKVLPQEAPVSESEFERVFNNQNMSDSAKAIEINRLLTEAGFDVATEGVISLTGFDMTTEVQESVLDLVRSKEYLTPVSQWVDKGTSISDDLVGLATIDLNVSEPFIGAKLKMDFGGITLKVDPTEVKTKKAKSRKKVVTSKIFNPDHVRGKIC